MDSTALLTGLEMGTMQISQLLAHGGTLSADALRGGTLEIGCLNSFSRMSQQNELMDNGWHLGA